MTLCAMLRFVFTYCNKSLMIARYWSEVAMHCASALGSARYSIRPTNEAMLYLSALLTFLFLFFTS